MLHMQVRMLYAATPKHQLSVALENQGVAVRVSTVVVPEAAVNVKIAYSYSILSMKCQALCS